MIRDMTLESASSRMAQFLAVFSASRVVMLGAILSAATASAQDSPTQIDQSNGVVRLRLPTITVTAQKESEDVQGAPVSVTAVTADTIDEAGIRSISEAAQYAPNTFFSELSARKLSIPTFRGIGSSNPNNPGVTTYIDGVPQLNANSSSIELIGLNQIEFVRGPQSTLFGRNALGGVINVTSARLIGLRRGHEIEHRRLVGIGLHHGCQYSTGGVVLWPQVSENPWESPFLPCWGMADSLLSQLRGGGRGSPRYGNRSRRA